MKKYLFIAALALSSHAFADCYVVGNFEGYTSMKYENYELINDAMTGQKFMVDINGENSSVTPNELSCLGLGPQSMLCFYPGLKSVGETWSVDPSSGKAFYTKTSNGWGEFDGVKMLIGEILGKCR